MKNLILKPFCSLLILSMLLLTGCDKGEDPTPVADPIASFQFEVDATDFLKVAFTNVSQNATSYSWDLGDGNTSTEESPTHTYAMAGEYTVVLTATASSGTSTKSNTFTLTDPQAALKLLTGATTKTWKLFREGTSMSLGPNADKPTEWWAGLTNDGSRPCLYQQEITFGLDGSYAFDDKGMFWAEFGVFNNVAGCDQNTAESCFESTAANMKNACGDDISAWGSGTHAFTYDPSTGALTLTGTGAWIGIPKLGSDASTYTTPQSSVVTSISIEQLTGYDVMSVVFDYGDAGYWPIKYVSYSDTSLEPALKTTAVAFGEDLPDASPTSLAHSFAEAGTSSLDTILSGSGIAFGVTDPAGGSDLVGEFTRTSAQFQELQFQTSPTKNDINFENLTTVSVDVYFPSSNDYTTALTKKVVLGFSDRSQTEQWWTDFQQFEYDGSAAPEDQWVTISFPLNMPSTVNNADKGATVFDRNDLDMFFLGIGSGDHTDTGTFYVKNLIIN